MPPKPICVVCGEIVLVSKQNSTEGNRNPVTGAKERFRAHNACLVWHRDKLAMNRLIEACEGNVPMAERIRAMMMNAAGSLTFWKRP